MAGRPPKQGIDFAGWETHLFDDDPKIDKLLDAHGMEGFGIYFWICQKAYAANGYYYPWSYEDASTTARKMGGRVGSDTIKSVVALCCKVGLFDKRLFERCSVLSSRGIQKRYVTVAKGRDVKNVLNKDYWLLKDSESGGLGFSTQNANFPPPKFDFTPTEIEFPDTTVQYSKEQYSTQHYTTQHHAHAHEPVGRNTDVSSSDYIKRFREEHADFLNGGRNER